MGLSCVEDFAGLPGEADFAAVERLETDTGRLVALGIDVRDVRDVEHGFLLDDATGLAHGGTGMALDHVHAPDEDAHVPRQDAQHLSGLALFLACEGDDLVPLLDLHLYPIDPSLLPALPAPAIPTSSTC